MMRNWLLFILVNLSSGAGAVTISAVQQRIEETLTLNANINLSDEALLGTVDIKVLSPLTEIAVWDKNNQQFNDMGLLVHVERETASPLRVTILNDNYQCTFGSLLISRHSNTTFLSNINYQYSVRSTGRAFVDGSYRVDPSDWQRIDNDKVMADLDINIRLPRFNPATFSQLTAHEGNCSGQVQMIFTLAS